GAVFALALQRARDLLADRRAVVRKRHQPRLVSFGLQPIAQPFRLRLLAALIEAFECYQESGHVWVRGSGSGVLCSWFAVLGSWFSGSRVIWFSGSGLVFE